MSRKHLHRYVNEFTGRHNSNDLDIIDQMSLMVRQMEGTRLPYFDLIWGSRGILYTPNLQCYTCTQLAQGR